MNACFQSLLNNTPAFIALVVLHVMIIKLSHKMELGFHELRSDIKAVALELKSVKKIVKRHDRDIKKIKKYRKQS
jgi:hypothetical protein